MDPETNTIAEEVESEELEESQEKIHVLIRVEKLVNKLQQFIATNKLHPGIIQPLFSAICNACIPKGLNARPEQYLFDEEIIDLVLSKLDISRCPKAPEPVSPPPAPTEANPPPVQVNSANQ